MKPSHLSDFTSLVDRVASENTQTTDSLVSEALRSTWHIVNTAKNLVFMCVAATPNKIADKRDAQLLRVQVNRCVKEIRRPSSRLRPAVRLSVSDRRLVVASVAR